MADPLITIPLDLDPKEAEQKLDQFKNKASRAGSDGGASFAAGFNKTISSGIAVAAAAAAAAAVAGLGFALKKSIEEATKQENAVNALNRSLAASGQFSQQASRGLQDFAAGLSLNTAVGGDVILQNAALIQSLARLDQQGLKRATTAALDLSAALGISFEQASSVVARAANGNVTALQKYGITVQKGATDTETFANALRGLEASFGGAGAAKLNTFSGQLERLSGIFNGVFESLGTGLIKSPALLAVIKTIGDEFAVLATKASKINLSEFLTIENVIKFGTAINEFVIAPINLLFNATKLIFTGIQTLFFATANTIDEVAGKAADVLNSLGVNNSFTQFLQKSREDSRQALASAATDSVAAVDQFFNGAGFEFGEQFVQKVAETFERIKGITTEYKNNPENKPIDPTIFDEFQVFSDSFASAFDAPKQRLSEFAADSKKFGLQIRDNLKTGIANGAGNAFAAFGSALASGENGLKAFADAAIKAVGQVAIQIGQAAILQGVTFLFDPLRAGLGPPLIAAGAALAAFGGAIAGGGGGSRGAGASGGSAISTDPVIDPRSGLPAPQDRVEPSTAVTVNIQGDVFDSEETGLRISNILRDASLNQNVRASVFA